MPIYEYYCPVCNGRFKHLARRIDAPPPPCPRCGNAHVRKLVSASALIHTDAHHTQALRQEAEQVNSEDPQAIAQFLQTSGRLEDAEGLYGSKAYRELLYRRAQGATDADLTDLVDDLVTQMRATEASQMAGAVLFSERVEDRMAAEGPPEEHEHHHGEASSPRQADDLGWA